MSRLLFTGGILVLAAAAFLIANTPATMAYTCSSSSSTQLVNSQSGVSGSSGSCSSSSSATTTSGPNGSAKIGASGPIGGSRLSNCFTATSCSATTSDQTASGALAIKSEGTAFVGAISFPGHIGAFGFIHGSQSGVQSTSSSSAGGSQSSCSSSSGTAVTGSTSSTSTSQPGTCP